MSARDYSRTQPEHLRARRSLRYAIGLLARVEAFLHDLPDRQCPQQLLEDIRLFHHTTQSDIAGGRVVGLPGERIELPKGCFCKGGLVGGDPQQTFAARPSPPHFQEYQLNDSIIVHGPQGCGKTRNKVALARHFGLANTLDDQDPHALPTGIRCNTLILTSVDLAGVRDVAGIRVVPYAQAAAAAGIRS